MPRLAPVTIAVGLEHLVRCGPADPERTSGGFPRDAHALALRHDLGTGAGRAPAAAPIAAPLPPPAIAPMIAPNAARAARHLRGFAPRESLDWRLGLGVHVDHSPVHSNRHQIQRQLRRPVSFPDSLASTSLGNIGSTGRPYRRKHHRFVDAAVESLAQASVFRIDTIDHADNHVGARRQIDRATGAREPLPFAARGRAA